MTRLIADFETETRLIASGTLRIAGIDEVGRGPLAGPVTAAAVVLDPDCIPDGLGDSKAITALDRSRLSVLLSDCAEVSVAHATVEEIDEINILRASHLAMCRALDGLPRRVAHALVDGNHVPDALSCPGEAVIKGDGRCVSIAAASIAAKVSRDAIMVDLAQQHPGYGWERNAGYPTKAHLLALRDFGVTPHHRRSFKPVHQILCQANSSER